MFICLRSSSSTVATITDNLHLPKPNRVSTFQLSNMWASLRSSSATRIAIRSYLSSQKIHTRQLCDTSKGKIFPKFRILISCHIYKLCTYSTDQIMLTFSTLSQTPVWYVWSWSYRFTNVWTNITKICKCSKGWHDFGKYGCCWMASFIPSVRLTQSCIEEIWYHAIICVAW